MRKGFLIFLSVIMLAPAMAQFTPYKANYDPTNYFPEAANYFQEFVFTFAPELSALSMALIAAVGLMIGLRQSGLKVEDRMINGVTVAIFIALFFVFYTTSLWLYFVPFVGFISIIGFSLIVIVLYRGVKNTGAPEPTAELMAAGFTFFLSWFAVILGIIILSSILGIIGVALILYSAYRMGKRKKSVFGKSRKSQGEAEVNESIVDDLFKSKGGSYLKIFEELKQKIDEGDIESFNELSGANFSKEVIEGEIEKVKSPEIKKELIELISRVDDYSNNFPGEKLKDLDLNKLNQAIMVLQAYIIKKGYYDDSDVTQEFLELQDSKDQLMKRAKKRLKILLKHRKKILKKIAKKKRPYSDLTLELRALSELKDYAERNALFDYIKEDYAQIIERINDLKKNE